MPVFGDDGVIYLDNAATTGKKPEGVIRAVGTALRDYSSNPGRSGHSLSQRTALAVYGVREKLGVMFGCETENVVFTANCTQALNTVIKGVLKSGDHMIISSYEHNAVARPAYKMAKENGTELDIAPVIVGDTEATYRSFEKLLKKNTRLIVCTHASNVTGEIMPIERIAELCRKRGILIAVDAAQTAGVIPIDMKTGIDYLCIAPHKGLYAPMGTGVLMCRRGIENTLTEGGTGSFSNSLTQPDDMPERFESGTLNVPGIIGISAGVDFIERKGIDRIYSHELALIGELYDRLKKNGKTIFYTDKPRKGRFVPVLSFNIAGKNSMETADFLSSAGIAVRAGLHCAPLAHRTIGTVDIGTVRVCPSAFNNMYDIAAVADAVAKL